MYGSNATLPFPNSADQAKEPAEDSERYSNLIQNQSAKSPIYEKIQSEYRLITVLSSCSAPQGVSFYTPRHGTFLQFTNTQCITKHTRALGCWMLHLKARVFAICILIRNDGRQISPLSTLGRNDRESVLSALQHNPLSISKLTHMPAYFGEQAYKLKHCESSNQYSQTDKKSHMCRTLAQQSHIFADVNLKTEKICGSQL